MPNLESERKLSMNNKAILIGRLCADPEAKTTPSGVTVCTFRIAVDRYSKGEKKADFINIVAWRERSEFICKYFSKGKLIGVEGSIQVREYKDKDGNKRNAFEVVTDRAFFVESKGESSGHGNKSPSIEGGEVIENDDDLPF